MAEDEKFSAIADEVARLTGFAREDIDPKTRAYHDAGLAGDDYDDFLTWFSGKYAVDLSGLNLSKLAPSEGGLGSLWPKRYLQLTIQDFIGLSEASSWKSSGLAERNVSK